MRASQDADELDSLIDEVAKYEQDPLGYVMFNYPWGEEGTALEFDEGPHDWQIEVLEYIASELRRGAADCGDVIRIARASGHGIGKSALVAWIINWAMDTAIDTRGVVTAGKGLQLATKTWPEVIKWRNLGLTKDWHRVTATRISSTVKGHEDNWRIDCETWNEHNTDAFQGLHNKRKRLLCIYDEASAIADTVWDVTEGALTDENTEIIWVVFGNPTRRNGKFFDCFNAQRHRWNNRHVDARFVPGTNKKLHAQYAEDYGEDSDFFRVRVKGEFPRIDDDQFIATDDVKRARNREPQVDAFAPLIMSVDIARKGSNQSVCAFRRGHDARSIPWSKRRGLTNPQLVDWIAGLIQQRKPDVCVIDGDGIGMMTIDDLRALGFKIVDFHGGQKVDGFEYFNRRAKAYGSMRKDLMAGVLAIPDDDELETDLTAVQYGFSGDRGAIQLESKEDMASRGVASPDCGDALAMSYGVNPPRKDAEISMPRQQRTIGARDVGEYWGED